MLPGSGGLLSRRCPRISSKRVLPARLSLDLCNLSRANLKRIGVCFIRGSTSTCLSLSHHRQHVYNMLAACKTCRASHRTASNNFEAKQQLLLRCSPAYVSFWAPWDESCQAGAKRRNRTSGETRCGSDCKYTLSLWDLPGCWPRTPSQCPVKPCLAKFLTSIAWSSA